MNLLRFCVCLLLITVFPAFSAFHTFFTFFIGFKAFIGFIESFNIALAHSAKYLSQVTLPTRYPQPATAKSTNTSYSPSGST